MTITIKEPVTPKYSNVYVVEYDSAVVRGSIVKSYQGSEDYSVDESDELKTRLGELYGDEQISNVAVYWYDQRGVKYNAEVL